MINNNNPYIYICMFFLLFNYLSSSWTLMIIFISLLFYFNNTYDPWHFLRLGNCPHDLGVLFIPSRMHKRPCTCVHMPCLITFFNYARVCVTHLSPNHGALWAFESQDWLKNNNNDPKKALNFFVSCFQSAFNDANLFVFKQIL